MEKERRIYKKHVSKPFLLLLLILTALPGWAQEEDFEGRYTVSLKKKLWQPISLTVSPELRYFDNHSRIDMWLIESDISVKLHENFGIGGFYRYGVNISNPDYFKRINRFGLYAKGKYRIKPFDLSYRCQFQEQFSNYYSSANGKTPDNVWRHKFQIQYSKKKYNFEPYAYAELFNTVSPQKKDGQQKLRLAGGIDYKLTNNLGFSIGYINQSEYNQSNPKTSHILTSQLSIKL